MTVQVGAKPLMAAHAYGGAPAASKTVNLWYAARLGATVATVVIALYVVHRWQAGRQAGAFVHQADVAEQQGDLGRAANYLRRYLVMRPGDVDARARLAMLMEETAVNAEEHFRAFLEMEEVLRQAPGRDDVRRRNISIAMDPRLAMYEEALGHLKHLRTQDDNDGTLCDLEGQCRAAQGNFAAAADAYDEAVKRKPDLLLAYVRRAGLLRVHLDIAKKADDTVAAMLSANKDSARAHVLAAGYYHSLGNAEQAAAQTV